MTRRTYALRVIRSYGEIVVKCEQIFVWPNLPLSQDFSKSVNSIDAGVIFRCSLFKKLANEIPGMSRSILRREPELVEKCHGQTGKVRIIGKMEKVNAPAIFLKIFGPAGGSRTLMGALAHRKVNYQ